MAKRKSNPKRSRKTKTEPPKRETEVMVENGQEDNGRSKNIILNIVNFIFLALAHIAYIDQHKIFKPEQVLANIPNWIAIILFLAAPFICYGYFIVIKTTEDDWKKPEIMLRNNKLNAILTASVFTVIFLPKFYYYDYPNTIADFILHIEGQSLFEFTF